MVNQINYCNIQPIINYLNHAIHTIISIVSIIIPKNEIWVFYSGAVGDRFAENPKYIYLYMEYNSDIRNIFLTKDNEILNELKSKGFEAYRADSLYGKYVQLRANVAIFSHSPYSNCRSYVMGAVNIYTSHGNYLKRMDKQTNYKNSNLTQSLSIIRYKIFKFLGMKDKYYIVTSLGPPADIFKQSYGANEHDLLPTGFPRNDILFNDIKGHEIGINSQLLDEIKHKHEENVIFYTPTHRGAIWANEGIQFEDLKLEFEKIDELMKKFNATLYIAPHPESDKKFDIHNCENIEYLTTGGDIYPFLKYCDILITDYSGIFYDFLLEGCPIIFFAPDVEVYQRDRGFYFEYESHVPGPVAKTQAELRSVLKCVLSGTDSFNTKRTEIQDSFYRHQDGNSAERAYTQIKKLL